MIITKTPFRVSFFGGGTDFPIWYRENGGIVLSSAVDKYCYVAVRELPPFFNHKYRIRYSADEHTKTIQDIQHPSARECLAFLRVDKGLEVMHTGDLPAMSGIGSSSSFTVGLLHALKTLLGKNDGDKMRLALDAIHVEQDRIKEAVGSQDQVAAAFGGFNVIKFWGEHEISVEPVNLPSTQLSLLQDHLLFFFTGFSRLAFQVEEEKIKNISLIGRSLKRMTELTQESINILKRGNSIKDFGKLLHENWQIKRSLASKVTNSAIDQIYSEGIKAGALGGKIMGAGGGGFIMFFAEPEKHNFIRLKLNHLLCVPMRFEKQGSQVIYNKPVNNFQSA